MQILVVVANIQMRTLKTEVGKVPMRTALGHGLGDPKRQGNSAHADICLVSRKGNRLIFLSEGVDIEWQHKRTRIREREPWEALSFLFNWLLP